MILVSECMTIHEEQWMIFFAYSLLHLLNKSIIIIDIPIILLYYNIFVRFHEFPFIGLLDNASIADAMVSGQVAYSSLSYEFVSHCFSCCEGSSPSDSIQDG